MVKLVLKYPFRPQIFALFLLMLLLIFGFDSRQQYPPQTGLSSAPPPVVNTVAPPLTAGPNCAQVACLALTFDDGPDPLVTQRVLDKLATYHAHASFFVIGNRAARNPALLKRMYLEGQEIGNHSWDHTDLTKLSPAQINDEVMRTQIVVAQAGVPQPTLFRPPYGAVNTMVRQNVPLALAMWNVDPEDWHSRDKQKIVEQVEAAARPGRVVDLHDTHMPTADALDILIPDLQKKYQLVTVSQLFEIPPGQRGEFYGR